MNIREAYNKLGLDPLAEFLDTTTGDQKIGVTTWVAVEAAVAVVNGFNALLVGKTLPDAELNAQTCLRYILKLSSSSMAVRSHSRGPGNRVFAVDGLGLLYWESDRTVRGFFDGRCDSIKVFSETRFQVMAVQRRDGPFAEVRQLKPNDDGSYAAFTATGDYLFDLTEEGAKQMVDVDPYRIEVDP